MKYCCLYPHRATSDNGCYSRFFYPVYVFFERDNLLAYPEPDEFNSNFYTISLSFVLILYCPPFLKK
jgi:hypothetical protein